jgi:high-affinity iron transporter
VPSFGDAVWDTSSILSEGSIVGRVLHTLIGYVAAPAGIQVLFYLTTIAVITFLMQTVGKTRPQPQAAARKAA